MLTFEDCVALSGLTEDEIDAIAEHEHLPEIAALELGSYLVRDADGRARIRRFLQDDIEAARAAGKVAHAIALKLALQQFLRRHPRSLSA